MRLDFKALAVTAVSGSLVIIGSAHRSAGVGAPTEQVIHSFGGSGDGDRPDAPLLVDRSGALYGTTTAGGQADDGTVFRLTPVQSGYTESILYNFQAKGDGYNPDAGLVTDGSGTFYGTTYYTGLGTSANGGTVFSLTPSGSQYIERVLFAFQDFSTGFNPRAPVVLGPNRSIYGTTYYGGSRHCRYSCGAAFELTRERSGYTDRLIDDFHGLQGSQPAAGLVLSSSGTLFGTTNGKHFGTVYSLTPSGSNYRPKVLYRFQGGLDGADPDAGLVEGNDAALYGATLHGGGGRCRKGCGTVFKLTPTSSGYSETILYRFQGGSDGADPDSIPLIIRNGVLVGTTQSGGLQKCPGGCGTVFELTPAGSSYTETIVYRFRGSPDGANPGAGLVADRSGALYGTTYAGGQGLGTVFKLTL